MPSERSLESHTGGRAATTGVIHGDIAISVGNPKTPLPGGWQWRALSDLARLETGHTPSRKHPEYWGGDVPWIGIKDASGNHGRTIHRTIQYTNELGIRNSSARILPANTVCLSRTASVGFVVVMGVPMATSQDFVNWVCGPDLDYRYLKYVLLAERDSFLRFASGTTHQTIYFPEVKAFHVALPSLSVQREIANTLSALDDRIANLEDTNRTLESIAQALFKSWFVDFDPVRAKAEGREPEGVPPEVVELFPSEFEESVLGKIPKGWEAMRLDEACEINPSRRLAKGTISPYLEMSALPTKGHRPDDPVPRAFSSGTKFINGDTLLARITPCLENGKTAFIDFLRDDEVGWGSTEYIVLRPKAALPDFWAYLLSRYEPFRQFAIQAMVGTSGRQRVEVSRLAQYLVAVPDSAICEAFASLIEPLQQRIAANDDAAKSLSVIRDTLLPRLMAGNISVAEQVCG